MRAALVALLLLVVPTSAASAAPACVVSTHEDGPVAGTPVAVGYEATWCTTPTSASHHDAIVVRNGASPVANASYAHDRGASSDRETVALFLTNSNATARYDAATTPSGTACTLGVQYWSPKTNGMLTSGALPICVPGALLLP